MSVGDLVSSSHLLVFCFFWPPPWRNARVAISDANGVGSIKTNYETNILHDLQIFVVCLGVVVPQYSFHPMVPNTHDMENPSVGSGHGFWVFMLFFWFYLVVELRA